MPSLTERQHEIASLVAEGLREQEIADRLGLTLQTIKNHKGRIYRKLGVRNAVELTRALNPDLGMNRDWALCEVCIDRYPPTYEQHIESLKHRSALERAAIVAE